MIAISRPVPKLFALPEQAWRSPDAMTVGLAAAREAGLEIGPGRGALTNLLARRARRVIAVEKDRVLAAQLRMHFSLAPNVEIIEGDILSIDVDSLFGPKPGSPLAPLLAAE